MKKNDAGETFVRYLVGAAITFSSLFFIPIAAQQLILDYRYSDIIFLSRDMQLGARQSPKTLAHYAEQSASIVEGGVCRSDILKSGLSVLLHNLDMQNSRKNYDRWEAAIQSTDTYLRHALSCMPTDGNLWLRYAMVSNEIAEQPKFIAQLIDYSQKFAPAEAEILRARIMFYNDLTATTLQSARASVLSDLIQAQQHSPRILKKMPVPPRKELETYVDEAAKACGSVCNDVGDPKGERRGGPKKSAN